MLKRSRACAWFCLQKPSLEQTKTRKNALTTNLRFSFNCRITIAKHHPSFHSRFYYFRRPDACDLFDTPPSHLLKQATAVSERSTSHLSSNYLPWELMGIVESVKVDRDPFTKMNSLLTHGKPGFFWWFQPTHLKDMLVKLDHLPYRKDENSRNI